MFCFRWPTRFLFSLAPATVIDCCVNSVIVAVSAVLVAVLNGHGNCFVPTTAGERVFREAAAQDYWM